jgi:hypothetical protein
MRRLFIILLLVTIGTGAKAQSAYGVRFIAGEGEKLSPRWNLQLLAGFERQFNEHFTIGLDVIKLIDTGGASGYNDYMNALGYNQNYTLKRNLWGLQYRSQYFFSGAGYIGPTIGIRRFEYTVTTEEQFTSPTGYSLETRYNTIIRRGTLIPIGLRFGFRTELDGWFQDIYVSFGMLAGNKPLIPVLGSKDHFAGVWFNLGYAIGIGW